MESHEQTTEHQRRGTHRSRSQLFTVRIWRHDHAGAPEYRGTVREVISGSYRNFRDWTELTSFMVAQLELNGNASAEWTEGDH